jgi:aminoglycoside phosphotransferase (APT) family kinase protein
LNPVLTSSGHEALSGARFESEVSKPIEAIGPLLEDSGPITALRDYFENELYGIRLPIGITHGDLSLSNLFVDGDERLTGVIDWEGSSESSLPVLDAIHYVESHHRVLTGDRLGRAITRLSRGDFADEAHRHFLFDTYERMGIASSAHTALVRLKWVRHIAYLASFWLAYSEEGIRDFVTPVVSSILESSSPPD